MYSTSIACVGGCAWSGTALCVAGIWAPMMPRRTFRCLFDGSLEGCVTLFESCFNIVIVLVLRVEVRPNVFDVVADPSSS